MCDTFIAAGAGYKIFGKNSDREPNEAQAIVRYPRKQTVEKEVKVTYISIPQVEQTNEVLLSRPFHMWGAEMGANEHGVVIGNEAVFTNIKFQKDNTGLTGMDLLRLALERTSSANQAMQCITALLEQYGQDANGGYKKEFYYHNSFLIADPDEHYVLETAGRHWVAKKFEGNTSISNGLAIRDDYDYCSDSIAKRGKPDFAATFRDKLMSYFARCDYRSQLSKGKAQDSFTVKEAIDILSSHGDADPFLPQQSTMKALCIHASGTFTPTQTTGSMIVQLRKNADPTVWFSGTSAPCISLYTPFYFGGKTLIGEGVHIPTAVPDSSLWWAGERLHRAVLKEYSLVNAFSDERKELQENFIKRDVSAFLAGGGIEEPDANSSSMFNAHYECLLEWYNRIEPFLPKDYPGVMYKRYRRQIDLASRFTFNKHYATI